MPYHPISTMAGDNAYGTKRAKREATSGTTQSSMNTNGAGVPSQLYAGTAHMNTNGAAVIPQHYMTAQVAGHDVSAPLATQPSLDTGMHAMVNQLGGLGLNGPGTVLPSNNHVYYVPGESQMLYTAGYPSGLHTYGFGQSHETANVTMNPAFLPQGGLPGYHIQYPCGPWTPGRTNVLAERSDGNTKEVPDLENRRSSYSTNESTPATPFFNGMATREPASRVAVFDRSSYTTPSPQQLLGGVPNMTQHSKGLYSYQLPADHDLDALLRKDPPIPTAVPAVFTPRKSMKTLEQSLENKIPGNRNVYIRGLHPTTDDPTLLLYAERFGRVETSKAIIDNGTSACKGFGFAKFYDVNDAKNCIRGFFRLGYEVGFARVKPTLTEPSTLAEIATSTPAKKGLNSSLRDQLLRGLADRCFQESFNSRLKAEGDDESTNLYISNLPKQFTESDLATIFNGITILSSKILRDHTGASRGVGFARFESREICDQIIEDCQGLKLGPAGMPMQIRYADTPAQKELKRITTERRQFRTNEYNVGAYGTAMVGIGPAMYNQSSGFRRTVPVQGDPNIANIANRAQPDTNVRGQVRGEDQSDPSNAISGNAEASSEDGSGDEGVTVHVDSPLVANGSSRASPVKAEKE